MKIEFKPGRTAPKAGRARHSVRAEPEMQSTRWPHLKRRAPSDAPYQRTTLALGLDFGLYSSPSKQLFAAAETFTGPGCPGINHLFVSGKCLKSDSGLLEMM